MNIKGDMASWNLSKEVTPQGVDRRKMDLKDMDLRMCFLSIG